MRPHAHVHQDRPSGNNKKIRCLLAHDHVLLRQGLRRLLEDEPDIEVVAEAGDAAGALEMLAELRPEVVITDASVFALARGQAEQLILRASARSKVVLLSFDEGNDPLSESQTGKPNWAVRQTSARELVEMIRRAHFRERGVMQEMPRLDREARPPEKASRGTILTPREREVLELLAEGKTVRSAAGILGLSVKTVDAHKFNLMRKLAVHNKAELVMWAIQKKYVKLPANF